MAGQTLNLKRHVIVKCSVKEFNKYLRWVRKYCQGLIVMRQPEKGEDISLKVYVWEANVKVHIMGRVMSDSVRRFETRLDGEEQSKKTGCDAFAIMQKYYRAPTLNDRDTAAFSYAIKPYTNRKFIGIRTENCIGYDMNSAFSYGMLQQLPDTTRQLQPGEASTSTYCFDEAGHRITKGFSNYRFEIMQSPYTDFINRWYNLKKNSERNSKDFLDAKMVLNASIGYMQNHNCFMRAAILDNFNREIQAIIKKYKDIIIASRTDSIVCTEPIPEIEARLGSNIGQFKIEHTGSFAVHQNGYSTQWNNDKPKYGAGKRYKEGYDILTDNIPEEENIYYLNKETLQLEEIDYGKEEDN